MEADNEGSLLLVPIRENAAGCVALRTGKLPSGQRIGMAFTSEQALTEALGPDQPWITLCVRVARTMFAEAGAVQTRIDPQPYLPAQPSVEAAAIPAAARVKTRAPFGSRVRPHIRTRVSFSGAHHAY